MIKTQKSSEPIRREYILRRMGNHSLLGGNTQKEKGTLFIFLNHRCSTVPFCKSKSSLKFSRVISNEVLIFRVKMNTLS